MGAVLALIARLALATTIALVSSTVVVVGITHAVQPPLPRLLYANNARLHLFETNCADWLAVCAGRDRMLLENLNQGFPVAQWSPDGEFIAVHTNYGWVIYRADCVLGGGECAPVPLDTEAIDVRLAWGPGGDILAYAVNLPGGVLRFRPRPCWDGSQAIRCAEQTLIVSGVPLLEPHWSEDGSRMVFVSSALYLVISDLTCQENVCAGPYGSYRLETRLLSKFWPTLSADGSVVVYSESINGTGAQVVMFNIETGQHRQLTFRDADSTQPDWSADDRYIAYAGFATDGVGLLDIYVLDLPRGIHVRLVRNPDRDMYPNWGPLPQ